MTTLVHRCHTGALCLAVLHPNQVTQLADERITDKKLSRRQFMGTAAAGAAVLGAVAGATRLVPKVAAGSIGTTGSVGDLPAARRLSEATIKAAPVLVPSKWSNSADVVVVGYGSAGAVAAITAFDEGANVL